MDTVQLTIVFGNDQETGVDALLAELKKENHVLRVKKQQLKKHEGILYHIILDSAYTAYQFGWRSAHLWKYMFREPDEKI